MAGAGDFRAEIEAWAAAAPDAPFLCSPESGDALPYGALKARADALAARFDRVMLLNHRLIGLGSPDAVFAAPALIDAYGSHLRLLTVDGATVAVEDTCCDDGTAHA